MAISNILLKKWYDNVQNSLECKNPERLKFEEEYRSLRINNEKDDMKEKPVYLMPHEFLFLLSNCTSRINALK